MSQTEFKLKGFTLIELAIVLFIVALLLGGLLPTVSSQVEQQRRNETRKQLDEIQQSLMGYAIINKRLPCPANPATPTIPGTANGAGAEFLTGSNCDPTITHGTQAFGALPWATLGLKETDAWEHRFTYAVTNAFTATAGFTLTTNGTLSIKDATSGNTLASTIPSVIISHGVNGLGAYLTNGTPISNAGAGTDEVTNSTSTTISFIAHDIQPNFDDMVVWITPNTLFNRMVAAGQLP